MSTTTENLTIVYRPIDELIPHALNARTHSDEQVAEIAASIREHGWTNPILIDEDGGIIAGHGRVLAARKLKRKRAPTITIAGMSEAQKLAYCIADNKLALNAGWDDEMLKASFARLRELDYNIEKTGFTQAELDVLQFRQMGEDDPNAHWEGMPNYDQENQMGYRTIYVHFVDEAGVRDFERIMGQKLTDKTKYIWHPQVEKAKGDDVYG